MGRTSRAGYVVVLLGGLSFACGGKRLAQPATGAAIPDAATVDVAADAPVDTAADVAVDVLAEAPVGTAPEAGLDASGTASDVAEAGKADVADGPPVVATPAKAVAISLGSTFACALLDGGTVRCWGKDAPVVTMGSERTARAISAGDRGVCAILDDGGVTCWAKDTLGTLKTKMFAADLGPGRRATQLATGRQWACGVLDNLTVTCWNNNWLYYPDRPPMVKTMPLPTGAGRMLSFALDWGDEMSALWEDGRVSQPLTLTLEPPVLLRQKKARAIAGLKTVVSFCVEFEGGDLECTSINDKERPNPPIELVSIARGGSFLCGLRADGTVTCWFRQLPGCSDPFPAASYWCKAAARSDGGREVALGQRAVAISAATDVFPLACALLEDGSVKCWGGPLEECARGDAGAITSCQAPERQHEVIGESVEIKQNATGRFYGAWRPIDLDPPP